MRHNHNHQKRRVVMPVTGSFQGYLHVTPGDKRYTGRRMEQNSTKRAAIRKREARLNKIGWSLVYFKGQGGRHHGA